MKTSLPFRLSLCLLLVPGLGWTRDPGDWKPLFQEDSLEGWVPVNVAPSTFRMEKGVLKCTGKPIGEIRTDRMYQNFVMEIEWRHMKPRGNAGIFIWADDLTARGQPFHRGIEIQVLENEYGNTKSHTTHGDIFPIHGAKMVPVNGRGGSRAFPTEFRSHPAGEWNHYRIEADQGNVTLSVNGKVVTRGTKCSPSKGYICLESEGGIVEYRNARIRELPDTPVDPGDVAIANRGYGTLYTGVDLSGWETPAPGWKSADWRLVFDGESPGTVLRHTLPRRDFGFVFDVQVSEGSGIPRVFLRGTEASAIDIDSKIYGGKLQAAGKWNRFEGEVRGKLVTGTINGEPFRVEWEGPVPESGPIAIFPDGPVRFANLFVRELAEN